jgi:hypothetical protein
MATIDSGSTHAPTGRHGSRMGVRARFRTFVARTTLGSVNPTADPTVCIPMSRDRVRRGS